MVPAPRVVGPAQAARPAGPPEWLEARRTHITATDIPVLLGISPWQCEQDLADEKLERQRAGVDPADADRQRPRGPDRRGLRRADGPQGAPRARALGEPGASRGPRPARTPRPPAGSWSSSGAAAARRFADGLPEDVEAQVQWQAFVAEVPEVDVAALTVGDDHARIFTVGRGPGARRPTSSPSPTTSGGGWPRAGRSRSRSSSLKRRAPGRRRHRDGRRRRHGRGRPGACATCAAASSELESTEKALKSAIQTRMADAAVLVGDGFRVTWKRTKDGRRRTGRRSRTDCSAASPEPERAALVGRHTTVRPGVRPFRVACEKEDAS